MTRIQALPTEIANQIAAGEVVERPASVVKELIENSLDGGATDIQIDIQDGGMQAITVADNGRGIHADDLLLAISSHATSKIVNAEDLTCIKTLGFRGEALASIASVSQFEIHSMPATAAHGACLRLNKDREIYQAPYARNYGTTVTVENLFFNTPARRKFIKSPRTEALHIENMVRRLALSQFGVGFGLQINARKIFTLLPCNSVATKQQRLHKIIGKEFLDNTLWVDQHYAGMHLHGWLATANIHRSQIDHQYWYLNGRFIRDKLLIHAVREAYADLIPPGRNPLFVLDLQLAPELVDVNVHPTKHEVRFAEPRLVHDFIVSALRTALQGGAISSVAPPEVKHSSNAPIVFTQPSAAATTAVLPGLKRDAYEWLFSSVTAAEPAAVGVIPPREELGDMQALLDNRLLVLIKDNKLVCVDVAKLYQLAAAQRFAAVLAEGEPMLSKRLLLPLELQLSLQPALQAKLETLRPLGFDWRQWHLGTITLTHIPSVLRDSAGADLVQLLMQWLQGQAELASLVPNLANYAETPTFSSHKADWARIQTVYQNLPADIWQAAEHSAWGILGVDKLLELL